MPFVLLLMLVAAAAAVVYGLSRPLPQSVAVGARVLLLTICATVAHAVFTEVRSDDTVMLAAIVMLIGGWIATLSAGRIAKPGVEYGSAWIVPTVPDRNSMVVAFACAAVLMTIVLLQQTSAMIGLPAQRRDLSSLIVFTICLACWSVIVASNVAPWRLHRRWTLPTTIVVVGAMAVLMPLAWWMTDGDGGEMQQAYQHRDLPQAPSNAFDSGSYGGGMPSGGGGDPFMTAQNAASSPMRSTFAASASIIASNMLAIAGFLFLLLRIGMARWARFEDDGTPMPGETTQGDAAAAKTTGPVRFAGGE